MVSAQISAMAVHEWHKLFAQATSSLTNPIRNYDDVQDILSAIHGIQPALTPALNAVFKLHAYLFTYGKLTSPSTDPGMQYSNFIGYHTHVAVREVRAEISSILNHELAVSEEPEARLRLLETAAYLRKQMLADSEHQHLYYSCYCWCWMNWIRPNTSNTAIWAEELQQLQAIAASSEASLRSPSLRLLLLAQIWMYIFMQRDQEAWSLLQTLSQVKHRETQDLFHFLAYLERSEEWNRLLQWLHEIQPCLKHVYHYEKEYFRYWDLIIQHLPEAEQQMWEVLTASLPDAQSVYEEKLLLYGKWEQWIDYQLSVGNEPLQYRVAVLAPIEKNAPEALLPFFHQAVERYVTLKNRQSYKLAVRLLKRLAKLYKKTKNDARWEHFITAFAARHSRLRALQEELRKGKLIT